MKSKQVKKLLSITLASAMIASGIPVGPLAVGAESENQGETKKNEVEKESTKIVEEKQAKEEQAKEEQAKGEQAKEEQTQGEQAKGEQAKEEQTKEEQADVKKTEEQTVKSSNTEEKKADEKTAPAEPATALEQKDEKNTSADKENSLVKQADSQNEGSKAKTESKTTKTAEDSANGENQSAHEVHWGTVVDFTWNGAPQAPVAAEGNTYTYKYKRKDNDDSTADENQPKEPGNYVAIAYYGTEKVGECNFVINKAKASFKWVWLDGKESTEYTGQPIQMPHLEFKDNKIAQQQPSCTSGSLTDGQIINAGKYTFNSNLGDLKTHYDFVNEDGSPCNDDFEITVTPKKATVVWDATEAESVTYDKAVHTFNIPTIDGIDSKNIKVTYKDKHGNVYENGPINAGEYTAIVELDDTIKGNYDLDNISRTLTIDKAQVSLVTGLTKDVEYIPGATSFPFDYSFNIGNNKGFTSYDIKMEFESENKGDIIEIGKPEAVKTVGRYTVRLKNDIQESTNFYITNPNASIGTLNVTQRKILIDIDDKEKVYGANNPSLTYSVQSVNDGTPELNDKIKAELGDNILKCDVTGTEGVVSENETGYEIYLSENEFDNYEIVNEEEKGTLKVTKLPITLQANNAFKKWKEANPEFDYSITINDEHTEETEKTQKTEEDVKKELNAAGVTLTCNADENSPISGEDGKDPQYPITFKNIDPNSETIKNYAIKLIPGKLTIGKALVKLSAEVTHAVYGEKITVNRTVTSQSPEGVESELPENENLFRIFDGEVYHTIADTAKLNAGTYTLVLNPELKKSKPGLAVDFPELNFEINKREVTINFPDESQSRIFYGNKEKETEILSSYSFTTDLNTITSDKIKREFEAIKDGEDPVPVLIREEGNNVGDYTISVNANAKESTNFTISNTDEKGILYIDPLPVTIVANDRQSKVYGAKDSGYAGYTVNPIDKNTSQITSDQVKKELDDKNYTEYDGENISTVLKRIAGENADSYGYELTKPDGKYGNFTVTYEPLEGVNYVITPLPITIVPKKNQSKKFGESEPTYIIDKINYDDKVTDLTEEKISKEINGDDKALSREEGEKPGSYKYVLNEGDKRFKNYTPKIDTEDSFTIKEIMIKKVDDINSRQGSFSVETNLTGSRISTVDTGFAIKDVDFSACEGKGVEFSHNIYDYIPDADDIKFVGSSSKVTVEDVSYKKNGKTWYGKLPAGAVLKVSVIGKIKNENGEVIDTVEVSEKPVDVTVSQVNASFDWSGTKQSSLGNGDRGVNSYVDEKTPLTLTAKDDSAVTDEMVEIRYDNGSGKEEASYYNTLNQTFKPVANNVGSKHATQKVTANIVDTLNINCESKSQVFYVDDMAFPISSSAIQFENRGKEIKIQVPEGGTIKSVTIPGGTITVGGGVSNQFTFPVSFSGKNLIPTGSNISVTYVDEAGHEGSGTAAATRSSVSTPITFRIRPELNVNGYLNGQRGNTLIISGVACACEPIRVTVAGMTQTTNATQADTWSDANGAWEVAFDMSRLPEGQDFTISAEYMDVNGTSYSMNAKYEAFVAPATVKSPIYEAMTHISGMVEPGTAVALVVNGEQSKYYEIDVDRFGRMSMDDVPMMFGGEDSFDIYVQDIAGNVSIQHYDVAEPGDPFEVTSQVNPLGKYFYRAEQKLSDVYAATPVSGKDFEESDTLELPLIMGMSYEVGKMTLTKQDDGIVVNSDIQLSEDIDREDYKVENEKLYVYRTRPTVDDLRDKNGEEFKYGDVIPLGADETIWLVDEKDMTILADDMEALEAFKYDESKEYETYQEQ